MHGVPVMALTASATHDMMKSIALALGMYQCTVVKRSCNRPNIYYEVQRMQNFTEEESEKWKELLEGIFGGIVSDLKTNGDAASKVIIFCFLKNDRALIYEYFLHKVGSQNLVKMFTNITDDTSKKYIISQFCSPQSRLRVVIATVAFGMGINCPDVSQVIHFRSPCSLLNYAQESGRCGRDGRQAVAKLYYSNTEFGICSSKFNRKPTKYQSEICDLLKMKSYVSNKSECRRLLLLRYFDGEADAKQEIESMSIPNHNCCDVCRNVCNCEECLLIEAMDSVEVDDKQMTDQPPETEKRVLSGYQRKCVEKQLLQLRASLLNTTSLLSPDHSTGFTSNAVKQVVENCETIFTAEDVLQKTDVLDPILAQNIIDIVEMEANPDILV